MFGGNWRPAAAIAACTSCAALSRLRLRLNCSVMLVDPSDDDDTIESRPAIVENWRSSGVATAEAIVSGLAPGSDALTLIVGKSTFGRSLTASWRYAMIPNSTIASMTRVVMTGRLMKRAAMFIGFARMPVAAAVYSDFFTSTLLFGVKRIWPSV